MGSAVSVISRGPWRDVHSTRRSFGLWRWFNWILGFSLGWGFKQERAELFSFILFSFSILGIYCIFRGFFTAFTGDYQARWYTGFFSSQHCAHLYSFPFLFIKAPCNFNGPSLSRFPDFIYGYGVPNGWPEKTGVNSWGLTWLIGGWRFVYGLEIRSEGFSTFVFSLRLLSIIDDCMTLCFFCLFLFALGFRQIGK